jgi:UDP-2,3-diacylglucosamine hydrolase
MSDREKFGLIAGNGRFPFLVLESARRKQVDMVVAAIKEETSPEIDSLGFRVQWLGLGQLGKLVKFFKAAGVRKAIMAGQVKHAQIFGSSIPDLTMIKMLGRLKVRNTDSLIGGVAEILEEEGITLVDSTLFLERHMASEGTMTRRGLSDREAADVAYGRPIAQKIAAMDLGQTIVVRSRAVVAVEAMEGTDAVIRGRN